MRKLVTRTWSMCRLTFLICLLLALTSCGLVEQTKTEVLNAAADVLTGGDATLSLYHAISDNANFEAAREAVEVGANVDEIKIGGIPQNTLYYFSLEHMGVDPYGCRTDVEIAEYLLEAGANPNDTDGKGISLLMYCCGAYPVTGGGADALFSLLLEHGADIELTDKAGYTALDYAVDSGDLQCVQTLLARGATISSRTLQIAFASIEEDAEHPEYAEYLVPSLIVRAVLQDCTDSENIAEISPILLSAAQGNSEAVISAVQAGAYTKENAERLKQLTLSFCNSAAVKTLYAAGFNLFRENDDFYLELAIQANNVEVVKYLTSLYSKAAMNGLQYAVEYNQLDVARHFLEQGALMDYEPKSPPGSEYPWGAESLLAIAAKNGNLAMIELLSSYDYPTNQLANYHAFVNAISAECMDIVRYFCEQGFDLNTPSTGLETPLEWAVLHGNLEIICYLVEQGAVFRDGRAYMGNAVVKNHIEVVQYLLGQGILPDSCTTYEDGTTGTPPLFQAVQNGRLDIVKLLVETGADVNGKDDWGDRGYQYLLHTAAQSRSSRILQYLIDAGAQINTVDSKGRTPLDLAVTVQNEAALLTAGGKLSPSKETQP